MWRAVVVLSEIFANLLAEGWRAVIVVSATAAMTLAVVVSELGQVQAAIDADAALTEAGQYVYRGRSDERPLDARRCLALGENPAVVAAGGLAEGTRAVIDKSPGELLRFQLMAGRMPDLLSPRRKPSSGDLFAAQPAAERIGLRDGGVVALGDGLGPATVSVIDMSARMPDPGPWLWVPAGPDLLLDECWVEVRPGAAGNATEWISAWLSQTEDFVVAGRHLGEDRFRTAPLEDFGSRPTRLAWLVAGVSIGLLLALIVWFRRAELALYRSVGSSRSQSTLILVVPYVLLVVLGALSGAMLALYMHGLGAPLTGARYGAAVRQGALVALTAVVVLACGTLYVARGSISSYIRQQV